MDSEPTLNSLKPVTSNGVKIALNEIVDIAEGKCKSYVIDDIPTLIDWLTNYVDPTTLKTGDIFLIRDIGCPDYWWEPQNELLMLLEYTDKDIIIEGKGAARVLETSKVDLKDYALKSEIPIVPTKVSAFENDKGYLTQHQSLSNYALKSEIPAIPTSLPANGGNADTIDNYHIRIVHVTQAHLLSLHYLRILSNISSVVISIYYEILESTNDV